MLEWVIQNNAVVTAGATVVIAVFTFALAILTGMLAVENRKLRRAGTDPQIVAYLVPHPDGNGAINFVLANIGQGPARNVQFDLEYDETDFIQHEVWLQNDSNRSYISVLPQGEKIVALFGRGYDLAGNGKDGNGQVLKPFTTVLVYEDWTGRKYKSSHKIDVSQFMGLRGIYSKPANREIADTLNKMEKHLSALSRLPTSTYKLIDTTSINEDVRQFKKGEGKTSQSSKE